MSNKGPKTSAQHNKSAHQNTKHQAKLTNKEPTNLTKLHASWLQHMDVTAKKRDTLDTKS